MSDPLNRQNPFTFGTMINDPHRFIGRRAELEVIIARLNGSQPQGTSVVGPQRIGKSSLLHYLYQPRADESLCSAADQRILYLDAQKGECHTPEAFRYNLTTMLLTKAQIDRRTGDGKQLAALQAELETTTECDWSMSRDVITLVPFHPVICLDEFETFLKGGFDNRFFDGLRSWANEGLLTWITASAQPLTSLGSKHDLTSPFFNLLATVLLTELTDSDADELLDQSNFTAYGFVPKERHLIRSLAGNHPYHLQIASWQIWEDKAHNRRVSREEVQKFLCRQPNPPTRCNKQDPLHSGWKVAIALLFLVVILVAMLTWRDPEFVSGVMSAGRIGLQQLLSYWNEIGNAGQIAGGVLFLAAGVSVIIIGIKQRKPIRDIAYTLWNKWIP